MQHDTSTGPSGYLRSRRCEMKLTSSRKPGLVASSGWAGTQRSQTIIAEITDLSQQDSFCIE